MNKISNLLKTFAVRNWQKYSFKKEWSTPEQIGKKSIEVNVSDIASMGKTKPLYAFVSLGIPKDTSINFIKKLFSSIKKTCAKFKRRKKF